MLTREDQIDIVCDQFEDELIRGERPSIQDFVSKAPTDLTSELFAELLSIEIEYRKRRGEKTNTADYLEQFPEYADIVETVGNDLAATKTNSAARDVGDDPSGTFLNRFVLERRLGAGAAGDVWEARDLNLSRTVAIKIPKAHCRSDEERERFRREGRTAAQLRHPNIVAVHEAVQEGDVDCIVADFIKGKDLRTRLAEAKLDVPEAVNLCRQVADALHYAHELGVVHRDLKPANIILDETGRPHLTDFGLAKWAGNLENVTITGQLLGTPAYMSPEQARGDSSKVDRRADVYALGVILYEMITGQCPFTGGHAQVLDAIVNLPPRSLRSLNPAAPRDLETVCLKALEKEPSQRYATAAEMSEDLRRFASSEPIRARRASRLRTAWFWARRRPAWVCTALLGPIAIVGLLSIVSWMEEPDPQLTDRQPVSLDTNPSGALLKFVPLNENSGRPEPDSDDALRARSPFDGGLKPGDYLVVAALADGRFHEVIRHVPQRADALSEGGNHNFWKVRPDGVLELPTIEIPDLQVTKDMIHIPQKAGQDVDLSEEEISVPSFFMDAREFTWGEYKNLNWGRWPSRVKASPPLETDWMPNDYDNATHYAELVGKRLMTREEYAQAYGVLLNANRAAEPLKVEQTPYQLTPEIPEWTQSRPFGNATILSDASQQLYNRNYFRQVVGVRPPGAIIFQSKRQGKTIEMTAVSRGRYSGIGFRGVRSERPRFLDPPKP